MIKSIKFLLPTLDKRKVNSKLKFCTGKSGHSIPFSLSLSLSILFSLCDTLQAKQTLAAECMEKELKILKDEVRALHVSFI